MINIIIFSVFTTKDVTKNEIEQIEWCMEENEDEKENGKIQNTLTEPLANVGMGIIKDIEKTR